MPKRFADTELWTKPWYRKLSPTEKCAFNYIAARCDNVGVWYPDFELANFIIGQEVDWDTLVKNCNGNIEILKNDKWFLSDFCDFQYGELSETCKPHQSYIKLLKKHELYERVPKGYRKGIDTHKDKEKEKDKELEKEKDKEKDNCELVSVANRPIYHLIESAFLSQAPQIGELVEFDFKREGPHIKEFEKKALARDGPEEFAKTVIVVFWRLIHSDDRFWKHQPFLPSVLNSGGIWPRVLKEMENHQEEQLDDRLQEIIGGLKF